MKQTISKLAALLLVVIPLTILAVEKPAKKSVTNPQVDNASGERTVPSLDEAREMGRAKSRFLQESRTAPVATSTEPTADLGQFESSIGKILAQKCVACHGPEKSMANLRIDQLNPDLLNGADIDHWRGIYKAVGNSEMPPDDAAKYRLKDAERVKIVEWLGQELDKASVARRNRSESSSFRRMTKYEYSYALQDLLGLPYPIVNNLPPETASEDGFKNSSELLQMSASQFEAYRVLGLKALRLATGIGERPQLFKYIHAVRDATDKDETSKSKTKPPKGGDRIALTYIEKPHVLKQSGEVRLRVYELPEVGIMRVKVRAWRTTAEPNEYANLRLLFGGIYAANAHFFQPIADRQLPLTATADKPEIITFDVPLSEVQRNAITKVRGGIANRAEFVHIVNQSNTAGGKEPLEILIDNIEVVAPHLEQWPPQSHLDIFFESKNKADKQAYGREVITHFLERAWRRPIGAEEVTPLMDLFAKFRPEFSSFEETMVEVLATALAAPEFLYITQSSVVADAKESRTVSELELANRLSFFLWSSVPDQELLKLARTGKLRKPDVLNAQVERMLADARAERFSQHFVEQWLGLDGMESVTHIKDSELRDAMRQEPIAFFKEALRHNSSVMEFLHSDYVVINERLAQHYGIPDVFGPHFRKVPYTADYQRGGVLTAAGLLTMNSNGSDSHPLKRGIWLLNRVLHDPPPPPPPDVPQVDLADPRILKMSLKERIADHRNKAACISCHSRIDPWGIAFENYDALGAWRMTIKKSPVDATAVLFNKQELDGIDGLKRYLLADRQDQFAKAMVHKMSAYALGRPLTFSDHADVDRLTGQFRKKGDRLRDLIRLLVNSDLFRSR